MKFRIHFRYGDGSYDSLVVSGETIEDIRRELDLQMKSRGATYCWSEELHT